MLSGYPGVVIHSRAADNTAWPVSTSKGHSGALGGQNPVPLQHPWLLELCPAHSKCTYIVGAQDVLETGQGNREEARKLASGPTVAGKPGLA